MTRVQQEHPAITVCHPRIKAQFCHQQAQNRGEMGCSHLCLQHRAPGEGHKVLLEGPTLKRGGQFPWQIMAVRGRLNVFSGWTYLIPEHRSDMLRTKIRPHMPMSQTRSPGASEMAPCPLSTCPRMNIGCCGTRGEPRRAVIQSDFGTLSLKRDNKGEPTRGGKPSPPQQQQSQGLYLTAVGIVGAAIQEHFQCTAKVDWDSNFLLSLQHERLAHFNSPDPPHPAAK